MQTDLQGALSLGPSWLPRIGSFPLCGALSGGMAAVGDFWYHWTDDCDAAKVCSASAFRQVMARIGLHTGFGGCMGLSLPLVGILLVFHPLTRYTPSTEVRMSTVTIDLPEDRLLKLKEIAERFGITLEELVRISVDDLLTRPQQECQQAIDYVVQKNAELYRRLS